MKIKFSSLFCYNSTDRIGGKVLILLEKFKETAFSVLPIFVIVIICHLFFTPLETDLLILFTISTALLMLGLALFNLGVDQSIEKMGNIVGQSVFTKNSIPYLILVSFLVGFMVTFAEPDLQVLGNQLQTITNGQIASFLLVGVVSIGTGLYVVLAMLRIVLNKPLKTVLAVSYGILFALALLVEYLQPNLLGVSFDSGGVTTGPLTVPFIMALGIGVVSKRASDTNQEDSFGVVGMASVGPIIAMLVLALFTSSMDINADELQQATQYSTNIGVLWTTLMHEFKNVLIALSPLVIIFFVLNALIFKISKDDLIQLSKGLALNFFGVVFFLTGVNAGFSNVAQQIGGDLITSPNGWLVVVLGFILGLVIVFAEPAIWVLNRNVEEISGGYINRKLMLGSLSLSVALAVAMAMLRIYIGFSLWWYLVPGYLIALGLMKYTPTLFTGIAFDSGGVSTGPMTATFILSMGIGAAIAHGSNVLTDAFGLVAVVAMMPLIIIQLLGVIYKRKTQEQESVDSDNWIEEE